MPDFIFATCQIGAEPALKAEVARDWPALRFAYSRPGFLTFKSLSESSRGLSPFVKSSEQKGTVPLSASGSRIGSKSPEALLAANLRDHAETPLAAGVFARASGFSLGKAGSGTIEERAASVWQLAGQRPFRRLHVWRRDLVGPDHRGKIHEPFPSIADVEAAIRQAGLTGEASLEAFAPGEPTRPGDLVLDCVVVEPDEWWIGFHVARNVASCWQGGLFSAELPPDAVSRAWLKMEEALVWSGLPIAAGDLCAEIGSAPGGASQALLGHGAHVIGIDPADMDPRVLAHPAFAHWKMRGADVRRREFRKVRWLMADINVAPTFTLDTVEAIVTHADVDVQGMLLTLKLLDWSLAADIPAYRERIRSWGFGRVAARQLHHNRQEICVSAQKGRSRRK
ncbi:MAG TPA: SAM-dependent methyltransferase [Pirellulales bacterium]|jgi:23S rRNA (cytidine2498-2'-O)-methyltransferase|nr:SAM-dependent methyltransferase [Pirellulales bacterium]